MDTTEPDPVVLSILRLAAEKIRTSPGLAAGAMVVYTAEGECYCMLGAISRAARELAVGFDSTVCHSARNALGKTIRQVSDPPFGHLMNITAYNDQILLEGRSYRTVSKEAKKPAIALFTRTIERLENSSC